MVGKAGEATAARESVKRSGHPRSKSTSSPEKAEMSSENLISLWREGEIIYPRRRVKPRE